MSNRDMLQRLNAWQFRFTSEPELGAQLRDTYKLSREQVEETLAEYRRFLYLCATKEDGEVTVPSPFLDQIWHLHLQDTRAYQAMCDTVFGSFIHHTPGRITQRDDPAYAQTLARYESQFGTAPPPRIWPSQSALKLERHLIWAIGLTFFALYLAYASNFGHRAIWVGIGVILGVVSFVIAARYRPYDLKSPSSASSGCGGGCGD